MLHFSAVLRRNFNWQDLTDGVTIAGSTICNCLAPTATTAHVFLRFFFSFFFSKRAIKLRLCLFPISDVFSSEVFRLNSVMQNRTFWSTKTESLSYGTHIFMTCTHYCVPGELARVRAAIVVEFSPNADLLNASRVCPTLVRGIFLFCVLNAFIPIQMIISDQLTVFWNLELWSCILFIYAYCWIPFVVSLKAWCDTKIAPFKLASVPWMPLNRYQNLRTLGDKKSRQKMVRIVPINLSVVRKRRWCEFGFFFLLLKLIARKCSS